MARVSVSKDAAAEASAWSGRLTSQRRMRELYEAAIQARGDVRAMLDNMRLGARVLLHRISILRGEGVARTITLYNPSKTGAGHQSRVFVRMASMRGDDLERFETSLIDDPSVTTAVKVTGKHDYRLTTFHRDWREAAQWARHLRSRSEVAHVEEMHVRHLFGHELPGVVLQGDQTLSR